MKHLNIPPRLRHSRSSLPCSPSARNSLVRCDHGCDAICDCQVRPLSHTHTLSPSLSFRLFPIPTPLCISSSKTFVSEERGEERRRENCVFRFTLADAELKQKRSRRKGRREIKTKRNGMSFLYLHLLFPPRSSAPSVRAVFTTIA